MDKESRKLYNMEDGVALQRLPSNYEKERISGVSLLLTPVTKDMRYYGSVYRPPSEAYSLIVQATVGCSHNSCAFCSMYKEKQFFIRPVEDILRDLDLGHREYGAVSRVFLADGDALVLPQETLLTILAHIERTIPECTRVGIYASPRSVMLKTDEQLRALSRAGLGIAYLGLESGCETVLTKMNKGETSTDIILCGQRLRRAGIQLSVTAISGLGGLERWEEHAADTAAALSAIRPDFLGLLTLELCHGTPLYDWAANGSFTVMTPEETALETRLLLTHIDSDGTVFRANHISNYLVLSGTLNRDRNSLISKIDAALASGNFRRGPRGL